jgi:hypothetical protein
VRPTARDEEFVHQLPELLPAVASPSPYWRESAFFEVHDPCGEGDAVFVTMALRPHEQRMDSLQMGRVAGVPLLSHVERDTALDPHTLQVPGVRVQVVRPFEELRIQADPASCAIGVDLTWKARTEPYALRRGTMRARDGIVWDQSHLLQSGTWTGSYTAAGVTTAVDGWTGQRDRSWGVREHARCPMWMWLQVQLEDGFLGVWHWELENGTRVYTDGCWAGTDRREPVPIIDMQQDLRWVGGEYGKDGVGITGLEGIVVFALADGRRIELQAQGEMVRSYEPFHRGGLSLMRVTAADGRVGSAIYEITGARHHRFFPDTDVQGVLPC